jgi:hypothetical protein
LAHAPDADERRSNQRFHPSVDAIADFGMVHGQTQHWTIVFAEEICAAVSFQIGKEPSFFKDLSRRLHPSRAFQSPDPMLVSLDPPFADTPDRGAHSGWGVFFEGVEHGDGKRLVRLRK